MAKLDFKILISDGPQTASIKTRLGWSTSGRNCDDRTRTGQYKSNRSNHQRSRNSRPHEHPTGSATKPNPRTRRPRSRKTFSRTQTDAEKRNEVEPFPRKPDHETENMRPRMASETSEEIIMLESMFITVPLYLFCRRYKCAISLVPR